MKQALKEHLKTFCDKTLVRFLRYLTFRATLSHTNIQAVCHNRAIADSADYADTHMPAALMFQNRVPLWDYAWSNIVITGLVLECGVFKGASINHFAKKTPQTIYGFDSFEGLKEDWKGHYLPKGFFNLGGQLPRVATNVTLIKGWFDQTLPPFLLTHEGPIAFLHLDSDTYEAAKIVFEQMAPRLVKGTVILFDEYFGYRGWRMGEWKAWQEYVADHGTRYRYLGFPDEQVAIILE